MTATTAPSRSSVIVPPFAVPLGYGQWMDGTKLWLVGALALVIVLAALIWVLRQRTGASESVPRDYAPPEVTAAGQSVASGVTFGGDIEDDVVDQTVPLSRLGGAGWRDGGGVAPQTTTDAYAAGSPSWADDESEVSPQSTGEHHVEVDNTGPRPPLEEGDRDRGGHW